MHGRSRGGDMTGGAELSAPMARVARRHGRARGERGKRQGLTANPVEATVRPGRDWSSRIPEEFAGGQRLKMMSWATLQGCRRAQLGGEEDDVDADLRDGSRGHDNSGERADGERRLRLRSGGCAREGQGRG